MPDRVDVTIFKVRMSGPPERAAEFLRRRPIEVYVVEDDDKRVLFDAYVDGPTIEQARATGLQVEVEFDDTERTRRLPVGDGNRFAQGGIPVGVGIAGERRDR